MNPIDPRNIKHGREIPSEGYCDQPYVVKTSDGAWLCVMTTGGGNEGDHGQHIVSLRSTDRGLTWSAPVDIEPADGPEASWVMPLLCPDIGEHGRAYAFYVYNTANMREVITDQGMTSRVDTLGEFAFKYSDDGGLTWSKDRRHIPVREMWIDRDNPLGGTVKFFWGVGKPVTHGPTAWLGFAKVGRFGEGFMAVSEGCFLRSDNILAATDPDDIEWRTLPDGDHGLRSPEGPVCDEANLAALSDGTLFATCRTVTGHPVHAYSRDGGHTWRSGFMTHGPGFEGELVNHPRAANFVRRLATGSHAGRFVYWFHNNSATSYNHGKSAGSRNPAWLLGGVERDTPEGKVLQWGPPEVVLYADHPQTGISYPDFIEEDGTLYITETQKTVARVHEVDARLLDRLFAWCE